RMGTSGYLLRNSAASELSRAIREVFAGRSYVTPLVTGVSDRKVDRTLEGKNQKLRGRRREVLRLLAEGHSMKEIAGLLNITPRTVAVHKYTMMKDLEVQSTRSCCDSPWSTTSLPRDTRIAQQNGPQCNEALWAEVKAAGYPLDRQAGYPILKLFGAIPG